MNPLDAADQPLLNDVRALIASARTRASQAVNAEMTLLYWQVGTHVREHMLHGKRAAYGEQIIASLARALRTKFGRGWSVPQLRHCVRIAQTFPDEAILSALRRELSWTHLKTLMYLDDPLKRDFYTELCRLEGWSTRRLSERINSMLYERTAIARQPDQLIREDLDRLRDEGTVSDAFTFRDPYVLDFLGLADTYSEHDLESAILSELQRTLIELGTDFTFVARQKRITIDARDYYIDLLFFHRRLRAMIAVDLKLGEFQAGFKGQMELYLRYLQRHEQLEHEQPPIGLILCSGKSEEHVELLRLDESNIRVAEYLTQLPSREELESKLHQSIEAARRKLFPPEDS